MRPPRKPFEGYKWRWAVLTPTESLNAPPVYLGVLRALLENEGSSPNSDALLESLKLVQMQTKTRVNLARPQKRNLIRNSGQYWKALKLLKSTDHGEIELTEFGRLVANGNITKAEFAATVIKTLILPNTSIVADVSEWASVGLSIKPLELILNVLVRLRAIGGSDEAYITPDELVKIIIPLSGDKARLEKHLKAIKLYRTGSLDIATWPNCAPAANDKRMVKEFLIFLHNYGYCKRVVESGLSDKYYLSDILTSEVTRLTALEIGNVDVEVAAREIRKTRIPSLTERRRVLTEIITRPNQSIFRNNVLTACDNKCLITGVMLGTVLEAAHIVPVNQKGADTIENGLCLRSDIHLLFDTGNLRIRRDGGLHLSEDASQRINYANLPSEVNIPDYVNMDFIEWRWKYY